MIKVKKLILLGPPGSGKGTIAQALQTDGFHQISTGDLFRKKLKEDSPEATQIQLLLNRGELIPDSITNNLAKQEIVKAIKAGQSFVLDGYPRTVEQAEYLDTICDIDLVIYLDVPEELLFKRITGRATCSKCQTIYNIYTNSPKITDVCDKCQAPLIRRRDDNEMSFKFRMEEFYKKTKPLVNYYENKQKLVKINGTDSLKKNVAEVLKKLND